MSLEDKIKELDERSNEVREILGKTPNWVVQKGTLLILIIIVVLVIAMALISYNDIVNSQIIISSKNPPVYLKVNSSGRLTQVFVNIDQQVKENQILAEIENTADLADVLVLKDHLEKNSLEIIPLDSLQRLFPPDLNVGDIQMYYGEFLTQYQNLLLFNTLMPNKKESKEISSQLNQQQLLLKKQFAQLQLLRQDLELSKNSFERNKVLHSKGVISQSELEQATRRFINDKQNYESFNAGISGTQISIANFNNLLTKSNIQNEEFENSYQQQLEKAYQILNNQILMWEQAYIIKSPIKGRVTVFDIWNKNQNVNVGDVLFTIVPNNLEKIIGRATLPIQNSGKIKVGQKAIIKLNNYPFQEWGALEGKILSISEVPKQGQESSYTAYVEIFDMTTSFDKQIEFRQEMQGTAEIVLEELTIMQRIFYDLRKIFNRS